MFPKSHCRVFQYSRFLLYGNNKKCFSLNVTVRQSSPSQPSGARSTEKKLPAFNPDTTFRLTDPPNVNWKYGDSYLGSLGAEEWAKGEEEGWKSFDPSQMTTKEVYPLMISGIIPRPIAFVSSLSTTGIPNLAPFSYFSMVAVNPPLISVSFIHQRHKKQDTSENIRATKEFTVNLISEPFVTNANFTSIDAPADVDEWHGSGLTKEPSTIVKPSRVKESAFSMECELFHLHDIFPPNSEKMTGTLILGHVKMLHVRKAVLSERGVIRPSKYRVVSRLGGKMYGRTVEGFELSRPSWEKDKDAVLKELEQK